jgi:hypothetical protein
MRPQNLHTTATRTTDSNLRKTSSRVVLQIQHDGSPDSSRPLRASGVGGSKSSSLASNVDTLFIILGIAVFLSVAGLFFVHRMSSAVSGSLAMDPETRGNAGWAV